MFGQHSTINFVFIFTTALLTLGVLGTLSYGDTTRAGLPSPYELPCMQIIMGFTIKRTPENPNTSLKNV